MPAQAMVIKPSVTNGSSGTCITSGSAMPVESRMAPPAPPSRPVVTEKTSWMRRRLTRSWKNEFQSRAADEWAAPLPAAVDASGAVLSCAEALEKKRASGAMERRPVVVGVGVAEEAFLGAIERPWLARENVLGTDTVSWRLETQAGRAVEKEAVDRLQPRVTVEDGRAAPAERMASVFIEADMAVA